MKKTAENYEDAARKCLDSNLPIRAVACAILARLEMDKRREALHIEMNRISAEAAARQAAQGDKLLELVPVQTVFVAGTPDEVANQINSLMGEGWSIRPNTSLSAGETWVGCEMYRPMPAQEPK